MLDEAEEVPTNSIGPGGGVAIEETFDQPTVGIPAKPATVSVGSRAPRNTPGDVIDKLNKEVHITLADPEIEVRLVNLGKERAPMASVAFGKLLADETEKWATVVKFANIKAE